MLGSGNLGTLVTSSLFRAEQGVDDSSEREQAATEAEAARAPAQTAPARTAHALYGVTVGAGAAGVAHVVHEHPRTVVDGAAGEGGSVPAQLIP